MVRVRVRVRARVRVRVRAGARVRARARAEARVRGSVRVRVRVRVGGRALLGSLAEAEQAERPPATVCNAACNRVQCSLQPRATWPAAVRNASAKRHGNATVSNANAKRHVAVCHVHVHVACNRIYVPA